MKKAVLLAITPALVLGILNTNVSMVEAVTKTYSTCATLNKMYSGGVAQKSAYKNVGGTLAKNPKVSSALYLANKKLDLDKDGIVCEVLKKVVAAPSPAPTSAPTVAPEPVLTLDNLDVKAVRAKGVREVIGAMTKALTNSPNVTLNYVVSATVPTQALADMKLQIDEASKLFSPLLGGQLMTVVVVTEKEEPNNNQGINKFTCGGRAYSDFRTVLCVPTYGTFGIESFGLGYHEFTHLVQYTQKAKSSNFFSEGIATYVAGALGFARNGVSDDNFNSWLNNDQGWKKTYEGLGYKYSVEDMSRFLGIADSDQTYEQRNTYSVASYKLGAAMWEVMIAVYGWDRFMSFFDSLDNGKTYAQNFESNYGVSLSDAHAKIAKYILSIQWIAQ
jgi:hypothetical protein